MAQLVEQRIRNAWVVCSSHTIGSYYYKTRSFQAGFCLIADEQDVITSSLPDFILLHKPHSISHFVFYLDLILRVHHMLYKFIYLLVQNTEADGFNIWIILYNCGQETL